eukprot:Clim_evm8s169 gene=Clim_evmTU8s169
MVAREALVAYGMAIGFGVAWYYTYTQLKSARADKSYFLDESQEEQELRKIADRSDSEDGNLEETENNELSHLNFNNGRYSGRVEVSSSQEPATVRRRGSSRRVYGSFSRQGTGSIRDTDEAPLRDSVASAGPDPGGSLVGDFLHAASATPSHEDVRAHESGLLYQSVELPDIEEEAGSGQPPMRRAQSGRSARPNDSNESSRNVNNATGQQVQETSVSREGSTSLRRQNGHRRSSSGSAIAHSNASLNMSNTPSGAQVDFPAELAPFLNPLAGLRPKPHTEYGSNNLMALLYRIAEDQARKEGVVHRGITCNLCSASPIRGIRYKCSNCVDFDLCEACEAEAPEHHVPTHLFLKIRIPIPPLANPRSSLLNVFYPGTNTANHDPVTSEDMKSLVSTTHFDPVDIDALYEEYKSLSTVDGGKGGISRDTFERCLGPLGVEKNLVTDRIFMFFDQDSDNIIDFPEFVAGLSVLCRGTYEEKIKHAFRGYDLGNTGYITRDDLHRMYKAYFYLSMELVRDVVKALEEEMMVSFDDEDGKPVSAAFTAPIPRESSSFTNVKATGEDDKPMWPVMEAMSQDAIEEMVDNAFKHADVNGDGMIDYEEFKAWAVTDATMVAWFEALGTVF